MFFPRFLSFFIPCFALFVGSLCVPSVQEYLLQRIATHLLNEPKHHVSCQGMSGFFPFAFTCDRFEIRDQEGIWLSLEGLNFSLFSSQRKGFIRITRAAFLKKTSFENIIDIPWDLVQKHIFKQPILGSFSIKDLDLRRGLRDERLRGELFLKWVGISVDVSLTSSAESLLLCHGRYTKEKGTALCSGTLSSIPWTTNIAYTHPQVAVQISSPSRFKVLGGYDLKTHDGLLKEGAFTHDKQNLRLSQPLRFRFVDEEILTQNGAILFTTQKKETGKITFTPLVLKKDSWMGSMTLATCPIRFITEILNLDPFEGTISGSLKGEGRTGTLSLKIRDFIQKSKYIHKGKSPSLNSDIQIKGNLNEIQLHSQTWFAHLSDPLVISGSQLWKDHWKRSPWNLSLRGETSLGAFGFLLPPGDLIYGKGRLNMTIKGTPESPIFGGKLEILSGHYEISEYGTVFHDVQGRLEGRGKKIEWTRLTARDRPFAKDHWGTLSGEGFIDSTLHADMTLRLNDYQVVQMDGLSLNASGTMSIKGKGTNARIEGDIALTHPVLDLEQFIEEEIPTLKIQRPNQMKNKKEIPKILFPIDLCLRLKDDLHLSGLGMDSFWNQELWVKGHLSNPYLWGEIALKKGRLEIFGKSLKIKMAKISYDDQIPNDPVLFLIAYREISGMTITLTVRGRASSPLFIFSSDPATSEEDAVAHLLFGKSIGNLSVGQSLQLALAISPFKDAQKINLLDKLRSSFGLDSLEFRQNQDENGPSRQSVRISKEFDRFEIAIEQDLATTHSTAGNASTVTQGSVRVDLTPETHVEVTVGGDRSTGISWNWIKRY